MYDRHKKASQVTFKDELLDIQLVNRFYQCYSTNSQVYIYKQRDLHDIVKTAPNPKGLFSCETFRDDDDRLILATISDKSVTSV